MKPILAFLLALLVVLLQGAAAQEIEPTPSPRTAVCRRGCTVTPTPWPGQAGDRRSPKAQGRYGTDGNNRDNEHSQGQGHRSLFAAVMDGLCAITNCDSNNLRG